MTKNPLFRPEVLAHQQEDFLGAIQLTRPLSLSVMTGLAIAAAALVAGYLSIGEYSRKARVSGYLVPDKGLIRLLAPQPGTVVEGLAREGSKVRAGDILFVLSVAQSTLSGDAQAVIEGSLAARVSSLRETASKRDLLQKTQILAIDTQIVEARRELDSMKIETDLQTQRLALALQAQAQYESLRNENFVSAAQVRAKAEEVLNVRAQLQAIERQRASRSREIATLDAQRRELPLQAMADRGSIDREIAALSQQTAENEARRRIVVRAPQDGTVTGVLAESGQSVQPAVALASLLPADATLQAHLFAPSSAVGFVRARQPVKLRYQAFPYQKFGHQSGEVTQVSRSPLQPSELVGLSLPASLRTAGEPLYRITVALDRQAVAAYGQSQSLAPGMQLEADVLLDRRRLIEWIFEPLLSVAGRV